MSGKSGDISRATHSGTYHDKHTGYEAPTALRFEWEGESRQKNGKIRAEVEVEVGQIEGEKGLIEKVSTSALASSVPPKRAKLISMLASL